MVPGATACTNSVQSLVFSLTYRALKLSGTSLYRSSPVGGFQNSPATGSTSWPTRAVYPLITWKTLAFFSIITSMFTTSSCPRSSDSMCAGTLMSMEDDLLSTSSPVISISTCLICCCNTFLLSVVSRISCGVISCRFPPTLANC